MIRRPRKQLYAGKPIDVTHRLGEIAEARAQLDRAENALRGEQWRNRILSAGDPRVFDLTSHATHVPYNTPDHELEHMARANPGLTIIVDLPRLDDPDIGILPEDTPAGVVKILQYGAHLAGSEIPRKATATGRNPEPTEENTMASPNIEHGTIDTGSLRPALNRNSPTEDVDVMLDVDQIAEGGGDGGGHIHMYLSNLSILDLTRLLESIQRARTERTRRQIEADTLEATVRDLLHDAANHNQPTPGATIKVAEPGR